MTRDNLVTVRENVSREDAKRLLHQHRIEKLLVVDGDYRCTGLITVKDIEKAQLFPHAAKDEHGRLRVAAAAGTGTPGAGARRGAVRRRGRHHGRRYRARPFVAGARHGRRDPPDVELHPGHRRQHRDRRGRAGADRGRRRRGQGRHRAGLDLHDPHGRRGRRAAIHRDRRCGRGMPPARRAGDRRWRHQVFRRSRQGDRRRRRLRDARLAVRRHRREPRRGVSLPGPQLQILPRHGLDRRDGARLGRPLFPAGSHRHAEAGARGRRGPGRRTRARSATSSTS